MFMSEFKKEMKKGDRIIFRGTSPFGKYVGGEGVFIGSRMSMNSCYVFVFQKDDGVQVEVKETDCRNELQFTLVTIKD